MMTENEQPRPTLPAQGIWTVDDLAKYVDMRPAELQQRLTDMGIRVIAFGKNYRRKLFRLEDLKAK